MKSPSGLVAQKTNFGLWVISGAYSEKKQNRVEGTCGQFACLNDIIETYFRKLWDLDYLKCDHECHKIKPMSKVLGEFEQQYLKN